jgi:hypothetical protein
MLVVKELLVYLMTTLRNLARLWLISWADENLPQHANQIRFLLNDMPRGQSLPTIVEDNEEGINGDALDDRQTAHATNYGPTTSNSKSVANNEFVQLIRTEGLTTVTTAA